MTVSALSKLATGGTERAHPKGCAQMQRATKTARTARFGADCAITCGALPPTGCERMSDDAKFILGIG
jgi:hypothetical protein